ncbi:MAG: trypsin-like peptidase domain-containing protein [Candidatus Moranbacteria bacterium]|nr:trypsin-like peptidase domain-containing protein [Candidatus Moranbacteria bacterium]MDD3965036.1 trypsin-like peptidase domain-containing protein [Candidatus Moranbacteria bacterium]
MEIIQKEEILSPRKIQWYQKGMLLFFALLFGFIGGGMSPIILDLYHKQKTVIIDENTREKLTPSDDVMKEQNSLIPRMVEKNSAGVVSIVVSKDVSKLRDPRNNFFQGFPFFTPFDTPQEEKNSESSELQKKQKIGSGSGFFVSSDGLIVTNKHVVSDKDALYTVMMGETEHSATVLVRDPNNDIAILKIEGDNFPALTLGDSGTIQVGQTVIAIGNALGEFSGSVTSGIISGLQRNVSAGSERGRSEERLTDIIQTDAAINPGNSGGPLFDIDGRVIGINVAVAMGAENVGFALPINSVKRIIEQVSTTGKYSVPYIGVRYVILNDALQKENDLPYNYGALILRGQTMMDFAVVPGSPADKAGLIENDIILEINGTKIDEKHTLTNVLSQYNVGEQVTLQVWHKGKESELILVLEERK